MQSSKDLLYFTPSAPPSPSSSRLPPPDLQPASLAPSPPSPSFASSSPLPTSSNRRLPPLGDVAAHGHYRRRLVRRQARPRRWLRPRPPLECRRAAIEKRMKLGPGRREEYVTCREGDVRRLPFTDNYFDVVVSAVFLHMVGKEFGEKTAVAAERMMGLGEVASKHAAIAKSTETYNAVKACSDEAKIKAMCWRRGKSFHIMCDSNHRLATNIAFYDILDKILLEVKSDVGDIGVFAVNIGEEHGSFDDSEDETANVES
ncbi:hypothetical protein C3L33_20277, partial [Rhododendron williamsianum]